ncbi:MAG: VOC family protein [Phyllobacterium sp.]|uniref:VOC family protein n=1 Tax=Phyllobacterium sp. TaxID=1871046 RepID=UPI0030F1044A
MPANQKITPCLWFDGNAEDAIEFYLSIFKDSKVLQITHWGKSVPEKEGSVLVVKFQLAGEEYVALNGGPQFKFNEAISLIVDCGSQEEVDYYWNKLTADGGEPGPCGWLKDKFGLSWQITPSVLMEMIQDEDVEKSTRVMNAMMEMGKIEIAPLQRAYDGN